MRALDPLRMNEERHFDAFISYASKDLKKVVRVQRFLESYHPTGDQKRLRIYLDRTDIRGGALRPELEQALAASNSLVLCCSEAAADSKWVGAEIEAFRRLHPARSIALVLLAGNPSVAVPAEVRDLEPHYHDLRKGWRLGFLRPAARDELLRLLALLTGRDLRSLIHWHRRRAMRQIAGGAAVAAATVTGVYWYVRFSRKVKPSDVTAKINYRLFEDPGIGGGRVLAGLFLKNAKLLLFAVPSSATTIPKGGWPWPGKDSLATTASLRLTSEQQTADVQSHGSTAGLWVESLRIFQGFSGTLGALENPRGWEGAWFEARLEAISFGPSPISAPRNAAALTAQFEKYYGITAAEKEVRADYSITPLPVEATLELFVYGKLVGSSKGFAAKVQEHDEDARGLHLVYFPVFRQGATDGRRLTKSP
jgi:TIR domain